MAKIFRQRVARNFGNRSGHFDAGRASADDYKSHCGFTRGFVRYFFGVFERQQNATPNFNGVLQTFQARCESFPFRVSEVRMPRTGRDDEIIVIKLAIGHLYFL